MKRAEFTEGRTPINRCAAGQGPRRDCTRMNIAQANCLAARNHGSSEAILLELAHLLAAAVELNRTAGSEA